MSRDEQLNAAESAERRSARIRARFGLPENSAQESVRDWLLSAGAIPTALAVLALGVYLIASLIAGFSGG